MPPNVVGYEASISQIPRETSGSEYMDAMTSALHHKHNENDCKTFCQHTSMNLVMYSRMCDMYGTMIVVTPTSGE